MTLGFGKSFVVTGALFSSEKPLVFGAKVENLWLTLTPEHSGHCVSSLLTLVDCSKVKSF